MNSLIILVTICAFYVAGVRSSDPPHFCDKVKDNEENTAILINCVGDNFPEAMLNLVTKCYRQGFDVSDGTWRDFVVGICDDVEDTAEQIENYHNCLNQGMEEALSDTGVTKEEAQRGGGAAERCISEKLGRRRRDVSSLGLA